MEYYLFSALIVFFIVLILFLVLYIKQRRKTDEEKNSFEKTLKILTETVEAKEDIFKTSQKDIESLQSTLADLERNVSKQKLTILSLQAELVRAEQTSSELKNENDVLQKQLAALNTEKDELQSAYYNLKNIIPDSDLNVNSENDSELTSENMTLDPEQSYVYSKMLSGENMFITGKAGAGKSYLLRYFQKYSRKKAIYTAPTGIAALIIKGETLHSQFGFDNLLYGKLSIPEISDKQVSLFEQIETLVIDEISMVSSGTFERLDEILKLARRNSEPFGGVQVIVFGDLFQLPPVVKPKDIVQALTDRFGGIHFFMSDAYKNGNFKFYELTIPHRQPKDIPFLKILDAIRTGDVTDEIIEKLNSRYYCNEGITDFQNYCFTNRIAQLVAKNDQSKDITESALKKITMEKLVVYRAKNVSVDNTVYDNTEIFYKEVHAPEKLNLKVGALVMMIKNDTSEYNRWVNGSVGIIADLQENSISVAIDKTVYQISRVTFEVQRAEYNKDKKCIVYRSVGSMEQFPLIPAYAITIHKAQGQTYKRLACDLSQCFANGHAYVALSRCESLDKLYLAKPVRRGTIKTDSAVVDFYKAQKANLKN